MNTQNETIELNEEEVKEIKKNEDAFLSYAFKHNWFLKFELMNRKTICGKIFSFEKFQIIVVKNKRHIVIFKHAIITIEKIPEAQKSNEISYTPWGLD